MAKHGHYKSRAYHCWQHAKYRCHNPMDTNYPRYGALGITMCDRWRDDFRAFLADMGHAPSDRHSIERINNRLGYTPNNCKWATRHEQSRNTKRNRRLTFRGETLTVTDWAARVGMTRETVQARIRYGWPVARILTEPKHPYSPRSK